jgi:enterobactin synthetase component F
VAYIVPREGARASVDELRRAAAAKLPEYMIPSAFVELDALPFNLHGKVDRSALPAPAGERPRLDNGFVAARTPVEERLAAIWGELLGIGSVGVEDDFFALGGHSILAAQAVSRMNDAFGITIPVTALFLEPTVARMAVVVTQQLAASTQDDELRGIMDELESQ